MDLNYKMNIWYNDINNIIDNQIKLNQIDFFHLYNMITKCISDKQIYTIKSIYVIIFNIFNCDKIIKLIKTNLSLECILEIIHIYLKLSNIKTIINEMNLINLNNEIKNKNLSIRQIFYNQTLNLSKPIISKYDMINIFNAYNLKADFFDLLDENKNINLIDEIFRPIELATESLGFELPILIIIPSYNNINIFKYTLNSIFNQQYQNYRIIYIDDCSGNIEYDAVNEYIDYINQNNRCIILSQYVRSRQCAGRYIGYRMAFDDEIIILLDGDDRLYNTITLNIISKEYIIKCIGATYGSYVDLKESKIISKIKGSEEFPNYIINNKSYREYKFITSHLRTVYAKILKKIKLVDLLDADDQFIHIMTDCAEMFPILEMLTPDLNFDSTKYFDVIKQPLCIYNLDNSLVYNTSFARYFEIMNPYTDYRNKMSLKIRSIDKYAFILNLSNYESDIINYNLDNIDNIKNIDDIKNIMFNFNFDMLILDNNIYSQSKIITQFRQNNCLHLSGKTKINKYIIKGIIGRNIIDDDIKIILSEYQCLIKKRKIIQADIPIIGYIKLNE